MVHSQQATESRATKSRDRMPVVYVGHGSPMNAIEDNRWSRGYAELGNLVPRPAAILAISAHWYTRGSYLTANTQPPTIHDFGGFPEALYEIDYPAPGDLALAESVRDLLGKERVQLTDDWGLDHGTWSVLRWTYPQADIPVVQLSINRGLDAQQHYEIGRSLAELRHNNILILASGNVVHNLRDAFQQMRTGTSVTPDWASRFDEAVKQALLQHDIDTLLSLWPDSSDGQLAHPTPDHWLPLLYAAGAADESDRIRFPTEGFDLGSLSMRNIIFG
jgi:4,5-DOPA dioxygenase extradiol